MMLKRSLSLLSVFLLGVTLLVSCQTSTPDTNLSRGGLSQDLATELFNLIDEREASASNTLYSAPSMADNDGLSSQSLCASLAYSDAFPRPEANRYVYASAFLASDIGTGNSSFTQSLANFPEGSDIIFILARLAAEGELVMLNEASGTAAADRTLGFRGTIRSNRTYVIALVSDQELGEPGDLDPVQVTCEEDVDTPTDQEYVGESEMCVALAAGYGERRVCQACATTDPDGARARVEDGSFALDTSGWRFSYDYDSNGQCTDFEMTRQGTLSTTGTTTEDEISYSYTIYYNTGEVSDDFTFNVSGSYDERSISAAGAGVVDTTGPYGPLTFSYGENIELSRGDEGEPEPGVLRGLVIGDVSSPLYDRMQVWADLTPYDGSQEVDDFDFVVMSNDYPLTDRTMAVTLISRAVQQPGQSVVIFDVGPAQKDALQVFLSELPEGESSAVIINPGSNESIRFAVDEFAAYEDFVLVEGEATVVELPELEEPPSYLVDPGYVGDSLEDFSVRSLNLEEWLDTVDEAIEESLIAAQEGVQGLSIETQNDESRIRLPESRPYFYPFTKSTPFGNREQTAFYRQSTSGDLYIPLGYENAVLYLNTRLTLNATKDSTILYNHPGGRGWFATGVDYSVEVSGSDQYEYVLQHPKSRNLTTEVSYRSEPASLEASFGASRGDGVEAGISISPPTTVKTRTRSIDQWGYRSGGDAFRSLWTFGMQDPVDTLNNVPPQWWEMANFKGYLRVFDTNYDLSTLPHFSTSGASFPFPESEPVGLETTWPIDTSRLYNEEGELEDGARQGIRVVSRVSLCFYNVDLFKVPWVAGLGGADFIKATPLPVTAEATTYYMMVVEDGKILVETTSPRTMKHVTPASGTRCR